MNDAELPQRNINEQNGPNSTASRGSLLKGAARDFGVVTARDISFTIFALFAPFPVLFCAAFVLMFVYPIEFENDLPPAWLFISAMALVLVMSIGLLCIRFHRRWQIVDDLRPASIKFRHVWLGLAVGVLMVGLGVALPLKQVIVIDLGGSLALAILLALLVVGIVPIFEEVIFRRMLLRWLAQHFGSATSIFLGAIIFSAFHFHFSFINSLYLFLVGIVLGATFYVARSLWPCIFAHGTINLFWVIGLFAKGI